MWHGGGDATSVWTCNEKIGHSKLSIRSCLEKTHSIIVVSKVEDIYKTGHKTVFKYFELTGLHGKPIRTLCDASARKCIISQITVNTTDNKLRWHEEEEELKDQRNVRSGGPQSATRIKLL